MASVAIAGASGVVGRRALEELLARAEVDEVVALGRRPLERTHPKLVSRVVDFESPAAIAAALPEGLGVAVCALGTTRKQAGSKEAFRKVDLDAVVTFARAARERGARRFVLVSAVGASAGAPSFYLQTKGEAEDAVGALGYPQVTVVRPSLLDDEGTREEHRLGERLALPLLRAAFGVVGRTSRLAPISAAVVGRALARLALDETREPLRRVEGPALHRLGA